MLTPEESKVLAYLRTRMTASSAEVLRRCLPGTPQRWAGRILANLEWLGYVAVHYDPSGEPLALQLTAKGYDHAGGATRNPSPL